MDNKNKKRLLRMAVISLVCSLINLGGIWISVKYQMPFWLDTVGTCLAAVYTNLPFTLLTVIIKDLAAGFQMPEIYFFMPANLVLGLSLWLMVHWEHIKTLSGAMISSFVIGLISIAVYVPMDIQLNGGLSMNLWGDALIDMLQFYGVPHMLSILAGEAMVNIIDKQLCIFLAFLLIRLINRLKKFRKLPNAAAVISTVLALTLLAPLPLTARAAKSEGNSAGSLSDYVQTVYDNTNGLPSTAVNMVAHTPDGSIWVGGYAGLCRHNGTNFTYITEARIANVTALLTDRKGRLWIGTNDQGIALWENEKYRFIDRDDGLPDNSIRSIFQAQNGDIYVGTSNKLCRINENVTRVSEIDCNVAGVWSIAQNYKGTMACVDYAGTLTLLENDQQIGQWDYDGTKGRYSCVLADGNHFLVGTSENNLYRVLFQGAEVVSRGKIDVGELQSINNLRWDSRGNLWICAYNGVGYRSPTGKLVMLRYPGFEIAIEDVVEDYEGNYWIPSSRSGLMKLSRSPFSDIYAYLGLQPQSVNAVAIHGTELYCATDSGLTVVNKAGERLHNALTQAVGSRRVRCVDQDSLGRLWVCTYGGGLLCWDGAGEVQRFTRDKDGAAGDYFRCLRELPDGTMAAGGSEGITFIRDGRVVGSLTGENGLDITQILCLIPGPDGTLYAGSDGSGIYVIRDGKVIERLDETNGLSSRIILRIIPYKSGYFVITSNSVNYMKDKQARVLEKFPYFNNFDMQIHGDDAWVLASCGLFVVDPEELLAEDNKPLQYRLFNHRNGFQGSLTANAWTDVDRAGRLYLCSNVGVQRIDMNQPTRIRDYYRMAFRGFWADGRQLTAEDGVYRLDADVNSIEIRSAVYNYDPEDLRLRFYLEGLEKEPAIVRQSALAPISYRNIPHGAYTLRLQILNEQQQVMQEISCKVIKEARMWENRYFRIYLMAVCTWMVIFATWVILTVRQTSQRKKELEVMSRQLAEQVEEQTSQIVGQAKRLADIQQHTIEGMATVIESRDGSTGAHVRNTGVYAHMLAEELQRRGMYPEEIDDKFVDSIARIAPLHDVGKIKISDLVLNKPGRLTPEEYEIMKGHTVIGGEVIGQIMSQDMDPETLQMAKDLATCHHERWDGRGYPAGKKGTEIPLCARIMAVADVFDALSSKRVYKKAMSIDDSLREMAANEGTQFQKELVEVFADLRPQLEKYKKEHDTQ